MFHRLFICAVTLLAASFSVLSAQTSSPAEPELSSAEKSIIERKLASIPVSQGGNIARDWSNAKKLGEVICRPAALSALRKKNAAVEKVFLGTDDPATLRLESSQRLTGTGQYRIGMNWTGFTFICLVDPATGKVTSFQAQEPSSR